MKKIYTILILFIGVLITITNTCAYEDPEIGNKKRDEAAKSALPQLLEQYKSEETPEEDRILDYEFTGYGIDDRDENILKISIYFHVTPVNEENTTWAKTGDICFSKFTKENGEYKLQEISRYPENYEKFLERFEEYKKNPTETIQETTTVQIEKEEKATTRKQEINTQIKITSTALLIISGLAFIITIRKNKLWFVKS